MDDRGQVDADEVIRQLQADYEKAVREVVRAVNDAPDGHWIDGSEEQARQALGKLLNNRNAVGRFIKPKPDCSNHRLSFTQPLVVHREESGDDSVGG